MSVATANSEMKIHCDQLYSMNCVTIAEGNVEMFSSCKCLVILFIKANYTHIKFSLLLYCVLFLIINNELDYIIMKLVGTIWNYFHSKMEMKLKKLKKFETL